MKQAQLLMAKQGYIAENDKARVWECLKMFKRRQHVPDRWSECSWPYFAGFFDAEGTIIVHPSSVGLRLEVTQVNPFVLQHLLRFLHEQHLKTWSLYHYATSSSLVCQKGEDCKKTLELLLEYGLLVKRNQAELALTLTAQNHLQIRDAISSLNGLQGRYQRLRLAGPERARVLSQLDELRDEHKLQKLISQCVLLRKDLRQSLRQGGRVLSATTHSS